MPRGVGARGRALRGRASSGEGAAGEQRPLWWAIVKPGTVAGTNKSSFRAGHGPPAEVPAYIDATDPAEVSRADPRRPRPGVGSLLPPPSPGRVQQRPDRWRWDGRVPAPPPSRC